MFRLGKKHRVTDAGSIGTEPLLANETSTMLHMGEVPEEAVCVQHLSPLTGRLEFEKFAECMQIERVLKTSLMEPERTS